MVLVIMSALLLLLLGKGLPLCLFESTGVSYKVWFFPLALDAQLGLFCYEEVEGEGALHVKQNMFFSLNSFILKGGVGKWGAELADHKTRHTLLSIPRTLIVTGVVLCFLGFLPPSSPAPTSEQGKPDRHFCSGLASVPFLTTWARFHLAWRILKSFGV